MNRLDRDRGDNPHPLHHVVFLSIRDRSEKLWCGWFFATKECRVLLPICSRLRLQQAAIESFSDQILQWAFGHHTSSQYAQHLCKIEQDLMRTCPCLFRRNMSLLCNVSSFWRIASWTEFLVSRGSQRSLKLEGEFSRLGEHQNWKTWKNSRALRCFDSSYGDILGSLFVWLHVCLRRSGRLHVELVWLEQPFQD